MDKVEKVEKVNRSDTRFELHVKHVSTLFNQVAKVEPVGVAAVEDCIRSLPH